MMQGDSSPDGYLGIVTHYEDCLARHGDTHLGVDWPNREDTLRRYRVMLDLIRPAPAEPPVGLLDFGCGASHLYDYMLEQGMSGIEYSGLDLSQQFVDLSRSKHPGISYHCTDVLKGDQPLPQFDYVVMNGVFTEKRGLSFDDMLAYFRQLLTRVFGLTRIGMAFNVMSSHVDWQRDDLFHLPLETLSEFLVNDISRHFVIRNDYGLYEYSAYVYREPENG